MSRNWLQDLAHCIAFLLALVHLILDIFIAIKSDQLIFLMAAWLVIDLAAVTFVAVAWSFSRSPDFLQKLKWIVTIDLTAATWYLFTTVKFCLATTKDIPKKYDVAAWDLGWVYSRLWTFAAVSAITGCIFIGEAATTVIVSFAPFFVPAAAPFPGPAPVNIPLVNLPPLPIHLDMNRDH
ncbi:hypothetical protein WAI453_011505 [Rhynchosporium graminicola]|uniref:Uncharacterized protein n=1 Tax=Rhynchosporium graminicola TaxID=2792576 RepID=A0A1E1L1S8_9HELO|nr:uncharacterized protein RCO7_09986 [Rhynchosporium commune]